MTGCSFTDVSAVILSHHYASTSCDRAFNCFFGAFLLVQIDLVAKKEHSFDKFKVPKSSKFLFFLSDPIFHAMNFGEKNFDLDK